MSYFEALNIKYTACIGQLKSCSFHTAAYLCPALFPWHVCRTKMWTRVPRLHKDWPTYLALMLSRTPTINTHSCTMGGSRFLKWSTNEQPKTESLSHNTHRPPQKQNRARKRYGEYKTRKLIKTVQKLKWRTHTHRLTLETCERIFDWTLTLTLQSGILGFESRKFEPS